MHRWDKGGITWGDFVFSIGVLFPLLFYDLVFSASHVLRFSAYAYSKKKPNREEKRIKGCRFRDNPFTGDPADTLSTVSDLTKEADTFSVLSA
ncbi:hypothetical protein LOH54_11655 [Sulfurimonas sp. HSL-3221]|uniref:hypothetical protein n=1 Tax=Sulfurimonadaceae TaxID=2771471 RepID=UPI001E4791E9|nr:hypothetical protein [Sulfurimonas sp. HSL-3221]UFS62293.1 hypothetical protein LOH54_11655 [Sulfurimonas sp. HSL-3221]